MTKISLAVIAQHTGVSKYAVSRSLSGKDGVSEETRRRVREAAAELGYIKDSGRSSRRLGIVFPITDQISAELHIVIQQSFQAEAKRLGYEPRMIWSNQTEEMLDMAQECAALAIVGNHAPETIARLKQTGISVVRSGWMDPLEDFDLVQGTDHEAARAVGLYLLELGHRNIVYVEGAPEYRGRRERYYGLREIVEQAPGTELRQMSFTGETTGNFIRLLGEMKHSGFHPTAFFCAHDGIALTAVSELLRLGYRIPEDVSVVGFGDYAAAMQITPHLTTVRTQGTEIGVGLVRVLDERIHGRWPIDMPIRMLLADSLVVRQSSGPVSDQTAANPS